MGTLVLAYQAELCHKKLFYILAIQRERLYWAGIAMNGSSESIFSTELGPHGPLQELGLENVEHNTGNLSQVTGLAVYDAPARTSNFRPCNLRHTSTQSVFKMSTKIVRSS